MSFRVFGSNRKEWDFLSGNLIDLLKSHILYIVWFIVGCLNQLSSLAPDVSFIGLPTKELGDAYHMRNWKQGFDCFEHLKQLLNTGIRNVNKFTCNGTCQNPCKIFLSHESWNITSFFFYSHFWSPWCHWKTLNQCYIKFCHTEGISFIISTSYD